MPRTGNPISDYERRDSEQQAWARLFPKCVYCGEHIQTERICKLDEWQYACEDCINDRFEFLDDFASDMEFNGGF